MDYVAVGDYDSTLKIYEKNGKKLSLHQTINDRYSYIW